MARRCSGQRIEQRDVLPRPLPGDSIDRAERPDDVAVGRPQREPCPRNDPHRLDRRVLFTPWIEPSVIDDHGAVRGDHVLAERVPHRVLAVQAGARVRVDTDGAHPERPMLIDQRHEHPRHPEHRRSETRQLVERLVRLGVEQPGRFNRCHTLRVDHPRPQAGVPGSELRWLICARRPVPLHRPTVEQRHDVPTGRPPPNGSGVDRGTTSEAPVSRRRGGDVGHTPPS